MEDKSIFNQTSSTADYEYINECIREVCLKGDSLSKYQKLIEKKFSPDFYEKCNNFVEEIKRSVERKKFTNTSVVNLKYLANEIHIPDETVEVLVEHFSERFAQMEEPFVNQTTPQPTHSPQPKITQKPGPEESPKKLWPWLTGVALVVMAIVLIMHGINNNKRRESADRQARYERELAEERRKNEEQQAQYEQQLAEQRRQQEASVRSAASARTEDAYSNSIPINAYIYDNDGDFTNIRNAPGGTVIDKIPTGQGRFGLWLDNKSGKWYHIRDSKVYDSSRGVVRELNGSDCWVHESIVVFFK